MNSQGDTPPIERRDSLTSQAISFGSLQGLRLSLKMTRKARAPSPSGWQGVLALVAKALRGGNVSLLPTLPSVYNQAIPTAGTPVASRVRGQARQYNKRRSRHKRAGTKYCRTGGTSCRARWTLRSQVESWHRSHPSRTWRWKLLRPYWLRPLLRQPSCRLPLLQRLRWL
jgi:hypothetical protein